MQTQKQHPNTQKLKEKTRPEGLGEKKIIRLADSDLDGSKKVRDTLRSIYGISFAYANAIIRAINISGNEKLQDLDQQTTDKLKDVLSDPKKYGIPHWLYNWQKDENTGEDMHLVGSELKSKHTMHIQLIKSSGSYRGYRHSFNYKMRGQRVKSRGANFRGRIGTTVGVTKKAAQQAAAQKTEEKK
ncbi:30S ribosomal protein S13 [Candidatus Parvarchaeota archaeon]|nr:30S ribosomal protein S13 [Candidatus Parvarchaeota archaeon]